MPELPEVETVRRGLAAELCGARVLDIQVFDARLRWPVPPDLLGVLKDKVLLRIERRAKYLLFRFPHGSLIVHLGMSGSMRIVTNLDSRKKHDHIQILFENEGPLGSGMVHNFVRYHDPRRFGSFHWTENDPLLHPLLREIGPEPLDDSFTGVLLRQRLLHKKCTIKQALLDGRVVAGVGNIYANEALFSSGVHPLTKAQDVSLKKISLLVESIKIVLNESIATGGTTLRDYVSAQGTPGKFRLMLQVYERAGDPCFKCRELVQVIRVGQRSTYFCEKCQKLK